MSHGYILKISSSQILKNWKETVILILVIYLFIYKPRYLKIPHQHIINIKIISDTFYVIFFFFRIRSLKSGVCSTFAAHLDLAWSHFQGSEATCGLWLLYWMTQASKILKAPQAWRPLIQASGTLQKYRPDLAAAYFLQSEFKVSSSECWTAHTLFHPPVWASAKNSFPASEWLAFFTFHVSAEMPLSQKGLVGDIIQDLARKSLS